MITGKEKKTSEIPTATSCGDDDRIMILTGVDANTLATQMISRGNFLKSVNAISVTNLLVTTNTTPANSSSNAVAGTLWYDSNNIYVAVGLNTIKKVALSSF
jgi:hypothetical protein